jgi:hypothetical protein
MSAIATSVYTPVTVRPRQTSAMTPSGGSLICLPGTALLHATPTQLDHAGGGESFRALCTKVYLGKFAWYVRNFAVRNHRLIATQRRALYIRCDVACIARGAIIDANFKAGLFRFDARQYRWPAAPGTRRSQRPASPHGLLRRPKPKNFSNNRPDVTIRNHQFEKCRDRMYVPQKNGNA